MPFAQTEIFENLAAGLHFLFRRRGQRNANRVADSLRQQSSESQTGFHCPLPGRTCLGNAQMQRPVAFGSQKPVCFDHGYRIVMFYGNFEILKTAVLKKPGFLQRRLDKSFRHGSAVFFVYLFIQRTGIDSDPQADSGVFCRFAHILSDSFKIANISRVYAHCCAAGLNRFENIFRLKMNIGYDRYGRSLANSRKSIAVFLIGNSYAHDVAAGLNKSADLT